MSGLERHACLAFVPVALLLKKSPRHKYLPRLTVYKSKIFQTCLINAESPIQAIECSPTNGVCRTNYILHQQRLVAMVALE